jgi:hypothetical protein
MNATIITGTLCSIWITGTCLVSMAATGGDDAWILIVVALLQWGMWGFFAQARYYREQAEMWHGIEMSVWREMLRERVDHVHLLGRAPWARRSVT